MRKASASRFRQTPCAASSRPLEKNPGAHQGTDTGFLGIYMAELTAGVKNQIGYNGGSGVAVQQVFSGSPADQAGIQPGDVILQVDGKVVQQRQGSP